MAYPDTPLVPGQNPDPNATDVTPPVPDQQQTMGLADQWRNWMASPQNRASMIQFGLALSQPTAAGQNWAGQVGQAFGQAGEASDRVTALQMKGEEQGSKEELRASQANLAGERALHAGDIASWRTDRDQLTRDLAGAKLGVQLRGQYEAYRQKTLKYNNDLEKINANRSLIGATPQERAPLAPLPIIDYEEWAARQPGAASTSIPKGGMGGAVAGTDSSRVQVNTPAEAMQLPSGTPYITPDGKTGTRP